MSLLKPLKTNNSNRVFLPCFLFNPSCIENLVSIEMIQVFLHRINFLFINVATIQKHVLEYELFVVVKLCCIVIMKDEFEGCYIILAMEAMTVILDGSCARGGDTILQMKPKIRLLGDSGGRSLGYGFADRGCIDVYEFHLH